MTWPLEIERGLVGCCEDQVIQRGLRAMADTFLITKPACLMERVARLSRRGGWDGR